MQEYLEELGADATVLDLGAARGSFALTATKARVIRVDLEPEGGGVFVCANAGMLPFPPRTFELVVANHSLEHFSDLEAAVEEVGRIVKEGGAFFVSVPDASTLSDRIYRWLGNGGGHVNPFVDSAELSKWIEKKTGLPLAATRVLHSGFSILNRKNTRARPKKLLLLGGGFEPLLQVATFVFRTLDRVFQTRLSVYGWAFYFGTKAIPEEVPWTNVCVRCGSGHGAAWLTTTERVRRILFWRCYRCPHCGTGNLFTDDLS